MHAQALLKSTPQGATGYLEADLRDPGVILRRAVAAGAVLAAGELLAPLGVALVAAAAPAVLGNGLAGAAVPTAAPSITVTAMEGAAERGDDRCQPAQRGPRPQPDRGTSNTISVTGTVASSPAPGRPAVIRRCSKVKSRTRTGQGDDLPVQDQGPAPGRGRQHARLKRR